MPGNKPPLHKSRGFQIALGAAISLLCLAWAFWSMVRQDDPQKVLREIGDAFARADYRTLPLIVAVLFLFYWLKAYRWRLLLSPQGDFRAMRDLFPPILIGFAFNNLLPLRLGEFIRCFVLTRQQKVPLMTSLASVALERILDGMTLLTYLGIGLVFARGMPGELHRSALVLAGMMAIGALGAGVYLFWTRAFVNVVEACLRRVPFVSEKLRQKLTRLLETGAAGLHAIRSVRLMIGILLISAVHWGLNGLVFYLSLRAFSIDVSWAVCCVLMGAVALAVAAPSVPGFFGIIQACFVAVLGLFVQNKGQIFAASVYFHISGYIPVTLGGLACFLLMGMHVSDVRHEAELRSEDSPALASAAGAVAEASAMPGGVSDPR